MQIKKKVLKTAIPALIFAMGIASACFYFHFTSRESKQRSFSYTAFLNEVYDVIQQNYWQKISEKELNRLFYLATKKINPEFNKAEPKTREELNKNLSEVLADKTAEEKEKFAVFLADIVLKNLKPLGRSALYQEKDKKALVAKVENINPKTGKAESTVLAKIISPNTAYIQIKRFSPSTFNEFCKATDSLEAKIKSRVNSLILDLRGNIGGSIDILPYFLGPFIGKDQYAYEFYHQGARVVFKTKTGWLNSLVRYKKVVVLIDGKTQSTAELMASVLKKYNVGVLIGERTRGWGTIERVFPLANCPDMNKKYYLFLVHSLALRDDNQPIEGRGVEPVVNIKSPNWQKELLAYFSSEDFVRDIERTLEK